MLYKDLIPLVENNIETLAKTWVQEVKSSTYMQTYHKLEEDVLKKRGVLLYTNLAKWLKSGAKNEEVEDYFYNVGIERNQEGFPLSEVNYALYLEKKVFWSFVGWKEEVTSKFEVTEIIELMTLLNNYFDLGDFFIIRGYLEELFKNLDNALNYSKEDIENFLAKGGLYQEKIKKIKENLYNEGLRSGIIK
jgi:hypothetical protein